MKHKTPRATFWARRAGVALILTAAAAFWGMATSYLIGGILLFTPTK